MRLDEMIEQFDLYIKKKNGYGTLEDSELRQIAKWLKELKKLREFKKHCKAVHGAFFNELAEQGIIT